MNSFIRFYARNPDLKNRVFRVESGEYSNRQRIYIYGLGKGIEDFAEINRDIITLSKQKAKSCILT
jgi:hypothetical protein